MKSIGDQAKDFRERMGWTTKQMAYAVGTSRQNIEALEKIGRRTPKYVAQLAKAMGATVDDLIEGRYVFDPGHRPQVDMPKDRRRGATAPDASALSSAVQVLSAAIQDADELTRIQLEPLASLWARKSDVDGNIARRIVLLLSQSSSAQATAQYRRPSGSGQDFEFQADEEKDDGSSNSAGDEQARRSRPGRAT